MKGGGQMRIQCTRCNTRLMCSAGTRDEFAAALEERGWRVIAKTKGTRAQAVCPKCTKDVKPGELAAPKRIGVPA